MVGVKLHFNPKSERLLVQLEGGGVISPVTSGPTTVTVKILLTANMVFDKRYLINGI